MMGRTLTAACLLLAAGVPAAADKAEELELEHRLTTEYATPHVRWGRPWAAGRTRVLLLCNGRGTVPRQGIELMQRFDVTVDAVFWARIQDTDREGWHGGKAGLRRMRRLAAKPYDVVVFYEVDPDKLPAEIQFKLLKPVLDGGGIVLVGRNDRRVLKQGNRVPPDGFLAPAEPSAAYRVGKGRGVILPKAPGIGYDVGWRIDTDAWQRRLGRAILWAAGRTPDVRLPTLAVDASPLDRADLPGEAVTLAWANPGGRELTIELRLRRRDGRVTDLPAVRSSDKSGKARRGLPRLRGGRYVLEAIARSDRGVEAFATTAVEVAAAARVEKVVLDADWAEVGGRLAGHVKLAGKLPSDASLRVRLIDRRERVVARADVSAKTGEFAFDVPPHMPMLVRVEGALRDGGGDVAAGHAWFRTVKRRRGRFNFVMWNAPSGTLAPYAVASLRRLGVTVHLSHAAEPPRVLAAYGLAHIPYTTRILAGLDKRGVMKPACWNDDEAVARRVAGLAKKYTAARRHGVFVYSLGDENATRGSCLSDHCLAAYRRYLKGRYGTIDKLNASWASEYAGFDDVALLKPDDNAADHAKRAGKYPRWFDRQAFRSWNYVQYCKKHAAAYRKIDPEALTGFEGAGRFARGDDIDLFVRELGFWSPYPGTGDEVLRSLAPRGFPRGNWMGYRKDAQPLIAKYWRMITRGYPSVWWWRWDGIGRFHGLLSPQLDAWPATRELVDETRIVRDGLGRLLMAADMQDGGVAMLHSFPSTFACRVADGGSYGGYEPGHKAWHTAIRDLGLNFRYVTDRQMRLGEFDAERYRVLILSHCEAIGPETAEAIEAFVRGGGLLIADVRPGIYTGHCKQRDAGCLDDLFGVRRARSAPAARRPARIDVGGAKLAFDDALCDPAVTATDGSPHGRCGKTPLWIVRDAGKGRAVLLNVSMSAFPAYDGPGGPEAAAELIGGLLAASGARPPVRVLSEGGRRTRNIEIVHWRTGRLDVMALFRRRGDDEAVRVQVPGARYVRDLRAGRTHRPARSIDVQLLAGRPTFLVLSERPFAELSAELPRRTATAGTPAVLRLRAGGAAGPHAVKVAAEAPDGTAADWMDRVLLVGDEPIDVPLPLAINDPAGAWKIHVRDLLADAPVTRTLTVEPRREEGP